MGCKEEAMTELSDFAVNIGEPHLGKAYVSIRRMWVDSAEVMVGNGASGMSYRVRPGEMRLMAQWLLKAADALDGHVS